MHRVSDRGNALACVGNVDGDGGDGGVGSPCLDTVSAAAPGNDGHSGRGRRRGASAHWGRPAALFLALASLGVAQAAQAQWSMPDERPANQVVLELYTAQGCSACPPADAMMAELAMREDVIALSLHVDYWDYIGWRDTFASRHHTERQTRYARRNGHSTIYTPQVVINGTEVFEGFRVVRVMETIASQSARPPVVELDVVRSEREEGAESGYRLDISARRVVADEPPLELTSRAASAAPALLGSLAPDELPAGEPVHLQLVRYLPSAHVMIESGENAGRQVQYFNIVTDWDKIGEWDMRSPLEMAVTIDGSNPAVVIMQEPGQGEIVAAARLR